MGQTVVRKKSYHPASKMACTMALFSLTSAPLFAQPSGPDSLLETYTDWQVRCQAVMLDDTRVRSCGMQQNLLRQLEDGTRRQLLSFTIRQTDVGDWVFTVVTPLGVGLERGLGISFDGGFIEANYFTCTQRGCIVREPLNNGAISAFRAGDGGAIVVDIPGQGEVSFPLSLNGFDAGWQRLLELN